MEFRVERATGPTAERTTRMNTDSLKEALIEPRMDTNPHE